MSCRAWERLKTIVQTTRCVLGLVPNARVLFRLVRGFLRVNFLRRDQIRFVEMFVTLACNARCGFCSNGRFTETTRALPVEKYLGLIDECADLDVPVVCLIGGEPLLFPHLAALVERIARRGMLSMVATNGFLATDERVRELAAAGLANLTVSLLSPDAATHDAAMGLPGAFQRAFEAREHCRKHGVSFSLATVVSHRDFLDGSFDRLVGLAERERVPLSVNPLIPTGRAQSQKELLLAPEDTRKLDEISRGSVYVSTHLTNNFFGFGCPAGNGYLGVTVTGDILPCFFIPLSLGNVRDMTLREAWGKARRSPLFRRRHRMCYAGVSREFISGYLDPILDSPTVPLPVELHPLYDAGLLLPDLTDPPPGPPPGKRGSG